MSVADHEFPAPSLRRLPFTVRLSPHLVNDLVAKRNQQARPGEVSGLLFGLLEGGLVIAQEHRMFEAGPEVSGSGDRATQDKSFEGQLKAAANDPAISALSLVGWYAIRESGGLTASDLAYHDSYFPKPNELALVFKPEGPTGVSLEVYCRTANGLLSEDGHRVGLVRLSTSPLESPVEVVPRPKIQDDFFMRAYETVDGEAEKAASPYSPGNALRGAWRLLASVDQAPSGGASWKGTLAGRYRQAISFLRPGEDAKRSKQAEAEARRLTSLRLSEPATAASANGAHAVDQPVLALSDSPPSPPAPTAARASAPGAAEAALPLVPPSEPPQMALNRTAVGQAGWEPSRPSPIWPKMLAIFALTAAVTFGVIYLLQISSSLPLMARWFSSQPTLGLKVEAQGERLLVTWNRQHPWVERARDGVLLIEDGMERTQVRLDGRRLANGSILYRPQSSDVTFRLEIHGPDGQQASDSVQVLDASKPAAPSLTGRPDLTPSSTAGDGKSLSGRLLRPDWMTPKAAATRRQESVAAVKPGADEPDRQKAVRKDPGADEQVLAAPEDAPAKTIEGGDTPAKSSPAVELPTPPLLQPTPPKTEIMPQSAAGITPGTAASGAPEQPVYQAPRPIRQVLPNVSVVPSGVLAKAGRLELLVQVDETGRVTGVRPAENGRGRNQALLGIAIVAARQWRFEPATLRGKPIASQHSIVFQFSPGAPK